MEEGCRGKKRDVWVAFFSFSFRTITTRSDSRGGPSPVLSPPCMEVRDHGLSRLQGPRRDLVSSSTTLWGPPRPRPRSGWVGVWGGRSGPDQSGSLPGTTCPGYHGSGRFHLDPLPSDTYPKPGSSVPSPGPATAGLVGPGGGVGRGGTVPPNARRTPRHTFLPTRHRGGPDEGGCSLSVTLKP